MNFEERPRVAKFRRELVATTGCDEETATRLERLPLFDLLVQYISWKDRSIAPRVRPTTVPEHFWESASAQRHSIEILCLLKKIEDGECITAHLSDKFVRFTMRSSSPRRPNATNWDGRDFALEVYDTHHLHLGEARGSSTIGRTDELLFIQFDRDRASVVGLATHRDFFRGTLTEKAERRNLQAGFKMRGVKNLALVSTADERASLLRAGISTAAMIDAEAVITSLISTNGAPLYTTRWIDRAIDIISDVERSLETAEGVAEVGDWFSLQTLRRDDVSWELNHCDLRLRHDPHQRACLLWPWKR